MKIDNFNKKMTSETFNNSLKEKFGYKLDLNKLQLDKAQKMLLSVNESLTAAKKKGGEKARNSKVYAEHMLIAETLSAFVGEKKKTIVLERRRSLLRRKLNEAEAQEAEVLLASKDMVDRIQKMIEDLGEMQNEQLQPLVDSVRVAMGDETASSFESAMSNAINSAMEAVRGARGEADSAARILSGEAPADADPTMGGDEMDMGMGMDADTEELPDEGDLEDLEDMGDDEPTDDAAAGRPKRDVELDLSGL